VFIRKALALVVIAVSILVPVSNQTASFAATQSTRVAAVPSSAPQMAASSTALTRRYGAMNYALKQRGKPYIWGGTGPRGYDCSGLVYKAYQSVGISLPRTTYGMLSSSKLIRIPKSQAHWGNLVFFSSGHVELFSSQRYAFGAHHSGTRISYRTYYGSPRFYKVYGA
jgi:cell wall-associated NlpC family hydrolase